MRIVSRRILLSFLALAAVLSVGAALLRSARPAKAAVLIIDSWGCYKYCQGQPNPNECIQRMCTKGSG